ncbi:FAD/NAD(P)-binding domain-containing protein [Cucurbitaria berberidis CBS 394.84]|uniref:FAD/NAD(P)-binding domain-containing protein n=1 Tax=Cucurbitaria berberidis CBS 394.84 TaxID=1168544 RepID=A0A9P4GQY1_9PLEO|nr:FAD/NAD(P)-binding domain-containing protein [Cucurbitaria berberidis CBS 394.84]KAF1850080.1 FAD/NAD(P)-binding domain-containing protein [Cucurbitaria berberidis CBS 394.84]
MATDGKKDLHVLIVGAGTSGLLTAQGLKKASISFTIFESETTSTYQTRPREWGMTLHWGSTHIASCLPPELVERFHEAYADPSQAPDAATGLPIRNGKTGELIMEMKAEKPYRVSRKKMRNLFKEGIDVQYGKQVERASVGEDGKVKVEFEDGSTATGDVLVGCDGAKSRVRESIVGTEAAKLTDVPVSMFNFPYKFDAELASRIRQQNHLFTTSIHPDHGTMFWLSIQDVPDPSKPETWTFQILQSWIDDTVPPSTDLSTFEGRLAFFKKRSAEWAEPWRSAGLAVKEGTQIPLDKGTYWGRASKWDNRAGRMTLCGDAAHPMTPHRGQGLNNALQDASNFVSALLKVQIGGQSLQQAVQEYDDEVLERGTLEMSISLKQTLFIHNWETLMQSPMVKIGMHQAKKEDASEA